MSLVSPPQTLTVGTATAIKPPANSPWSAAVIQNLSPYLIEIQAGSQVAWLAPFTSDIFAPGPTQTPIAATPQAIVGSLVSTLGGAQVQATWYNPDEAAALQATYPSALPGSAVIAATAPPGLVYGPMATVIVAGQVQFVVTVPSTTRTLLIESFGGAGGIGPTTVQVVGNQTGTIYRQSLPPYLNSIFGSGEGSLCVVPVLGAADTTFTITIGQANALVTETTTVYADSVTTQESVLYNGIAKGGAAFLGGATTAVIATGPCRLLTASCIAVNAGANCGLILSQAGGPNNPILFTEATAAVTTQVAAVTFPPNTILPAGQTLTLNQGAAGNTGGFCTFAYP